MRVWVVVDQGSEMDGSDKTLVAVYASEETAKKAREVEQDVEGPFEVFEDEAEGAVTKGELVRALGLLIGGETIQELSEATIEAIRSVYKRAKREGL